MAMTREQESYRLRELAAVAPVIANGELWPLTYEATRLATELDEAIRNHDRSTPALVAMYSAALEHLGERLFSRTLCTLLCASEPPDLTGAAVLVRETLRGRVWLAERHVRRRSRT